jgi:predicted O-linked N-acetylglucosamine transferase (SPINDLY family)
MSQQGGSALSALLQAAFQHHQAGRLSQAEQLYREILGRDDRHPDALHLLGVMALQAGRNDIALGLIGKAIGVSPNFATYYANFGVALYNLGRFGEAVGAYDAALRASPDHADAHSNRGNALKALGRLDAALAAYDAALLLFPGHSDAHYNRGIVLAALDRPEAALAAYDAAIRLNPGQPQTYCNRGIVLSDLDRIDNALASYRAALCLNPSHAEALSNRGGALYGLGRLAEALAACNAALRIKRDYAEALSNRAPVLQEFARLDEALDSCDAALRIRPDYAEAHCNRGNVLYDLGRLTEAIAAYEAALGVRPDYTEAASKLIHCRQCLCSWAGLAAQKQAFLEQFPTSRDNNPPFTLLTIDSTAEQQLVAARRYAKKLGGPVITPPCGLPRGAGKIRLGYLSADFRQHPTSQLIAELIERHDRRRFDIIGYSFGPDDGSAMRRRMARAFDRFVDLRSLSHTDAAQQIRHDGIDIAIDLMGYTRDARPKILACRPAPVQVNFLGYPGTMGADFIDYVIADPICIPPGDEAFFSEKVVRLPDCYQPNDRQRQIAEQSPSRQDCGLPERSFVFCCFNNSFKITPTLFALWMRLLHKVPDSVLWLLEANPTMADNLRREAVAAGIGPDRLIFAQRLPLPGHLARHRSADLFLDTLPYNAHTTASDALWAGLPVLTCRGETFAGRVAASLLTAVGLKDLVTSSLDEYQTLALALAAEPARLASFKQTLSANRATAPLFDSERFARSLETAFEQMSSRDGNR